MMKNLPMEYPLRVLSSGNKTVVIEYSVDETSVP